MKASTWGSAVGLVVCAIALGACGDGDGTSTSGNSELFTTAGFQKALDAVEEKSGGRPALQVRITSGGADFKLRDGEQATGFVYTGGDVHDEKVDVIGPGSLEGQDFPFDEIDPAAIDEIVSGVESESGVEGIKVTVMTLEKGAVDGKLKWTVNAEGGGRTGLVYTADTDGSNVTSPLGDVAGGEPGIGTVDENISTVPNGKSVQEVTDCIRQAGTDVDEIQACAQQ